MHNHLYYKGVFPRCQTLLKQRATSLVRLSPLPQLIYTIFFGFEKNYVSWGEAANQPMQGKSLKEVLGKYIFGKDISQCKSVTVSNWGS